MATPPTTLSAKQPPPMVDLLLELAVVISTKRRNLMLKKASGLTLMEKLLNPIVFTMLGLLLKLALGIGLLATLWEVAKYQPKRKRQSKTVNQRKLILPQIQPMNGKIPRPKHTPPDLDQQKVLRKPAQSITQS